MKTTILLLFFVCPFLMLAQWTTISDPMIGEAAYDEFATSISLNQAGNIIVVGAPSNDGNGSSSGHVRVYENIGGIWTQIGQDIDGKTNGERAGFSVSINNTGNIIAFGAWGSNSWAGHARVYENIAGTWTQVGQDIAGEASDDRSGYAVSINGAGNIIAVTAKNNDGNGSNSGHIRIFENIAGVWTQIGQDIDGRASGVELGYTVEINDAGTIVAASSPFDGAGRVQVFENISGTWTQMGNDLTPPFDGSGGSRFGSDISLNSDGTILAVGSNSFNTPNGVNSGAAFVYQYGGSNWSLIRSFNGEAGSDNFGDAVSLNDAGNVLAVGAPSNSDGASFGGHVRVFNGTTQVGNDIDGTFTYDFSGQEVALNNDGSILAIGDPGNYSGDLRGHVRLWQNTTLSMEDHHTLNLAIATNPVINELQVFYPSLYSNVDLKIYDLTGRLIFNRIDTHVSASVLNVGTLRTGTYLLIVETGTSKQLIKFMKK